jgi:hypothetical protein
VEQSRQRWRKKAETRERELTVLQAQLQKLQEQVGSAADEPVEKGLRLS